jgi:hypothetical protein
VDYHRDQAVLKAERERGFKPLPAPSKLNSPGPLSPGKPANPPGFKQSTGAY